MKTVSMIVHHGDYNHYETATADSCEDALKVILKTPMGIGYAPKVHLGQQSQFDRLVTDLNNAGAAKWGWADYKLTEAAGLPEFPEVEA